MFESIQFTLKVMKKRPLRSLLTVLQLALGVWIVAIILSLNFQATSSLATANEDLLDTLARVSVVRSQEPGFGRMQSFASNLRLADLDLLLESERIASAFFYESSWSRDIIVNDLAYRVSVLGEASAGFAEALGLEMVEGHFFTLADLEQQNQVVVISEAISQQLFPGQSALGQKISLGRFREDTREYSVIGVYEKPSPYLQFFLAEPFLIFPLGYDRRGGSLRAGYSEVFIKSEPGQVYEAVADVSILLAEQVSSDLEVQADYFRDSNHFITNQILTISLFLGAFAFVSILISAIGILSIMLVSVVERTREIGLRKALGASKWQIVWQVLNESIVISVLGAALGLLVAYFSAESLVNLLVQEVIYSSITDLGGLHPQAAFIGTSLAIIVGLLFGFYPAWQVAKQLPVEALKDA